MDELDSLRKKRMVDLQARLQEEQAKKEQLAQVEAQIKDVMNQILTPEARSRLSNIKMAKPEYGTQIELLMVQLAQSGQIKGKITDAQLKALLSRIKKPKKEFRIRRV